MLSATGYAYLSDFIARAFPPGCFETAFTCLAVVTVALADWEPDDALRIDADIDLLLASGAGDDELARWLESAGLSVVLETEGYTARSFLEMIAVSIRRHTRRQRFKRRRTSASKR
jgi:hypothetical protein